MVDHVFTGRHWPFGGTSIGRGCAYRNTFNQPFMPTTRDLPGFMRNARNVNSLIATNAARLITRSIRHMNTRQRIRRYARNHPFGSTIVANMPYPRYTRRRAISDRWVVSRNARRRLR